MRCDMLRGRRDEKDGENQRPEKDTLAFLLPERRAHPTSSFSESPTSNRAIMSKYQV
jgi:hypothetical protein